MSPEPPSPRGTSTSRPPAPAPPALFDAYQASAGTLDEFQRLQAGPASLWQPFVDRINTLGATGLATAWKRGEDLLHENGIAHNPVSDGSASERRWDLDPIPFLLSEAEWETLRDGVIQRAHLWNRFLHDCYGAQELLHEGLLPPSLLFSQLNYNRSLRHLPDPQRPLLTLYAVDVARAPDGSWMVVADRTEAPNGTGFALENRIVINGVFPETTKRLHLLRLAPYFQALRTALVALAPSAVDSPHVVLLSPGPGDHTYFEDAYLSRYLGISLAVGEELTVRDDRLYLKTVSGLKRVHVLVRRVPETVSDPLEIPTNSHLGVPGLMQVIRAGGVCVVNPPGTGIAEAPALLPFLPAIARRLLGEDLLIPSIETSWGGDHPDLHGSFDPATSVVKSAVARHLFPPSITRTLSDEQLEKVRQKLAAEPDRYVVQREMPFSTAPAWNGESLEPRRVAIRLFLFAEKDSYRVMPGGLVRCASQSDALPGLSLRTQTNSKDLWILSDRPRPESVATNLPTHQEIRRVSGTLSSRAADNMLWIGRYSERAEYATRVLLEVIRCTTDEQDSGASPALLPLLKTLAHHDYLDPALDLAKLVSNRAALLEALQPLFFERAPERSASLDSIPQNLRRLRSLAALSRNRLSQEAWRITQGLAQLVRGPLPRILANFHPPLQQGILYQSAFNGTCRENLTRSDSWRFLNIGRRLERCTWLLTLVDEVLALYPDLPSSVLDAALSVADCTLTYRFRYHGAPTPLATLDLLLYDPANPRGLAYGVADLDCDFRALPSSDPHQILRPAHRTILRALHHLQTELLVSGDPEEEADLVRTLKHFVADLREEFPGVAEQLGWEFFTHATFTSS